MTATDEALTPEDLRTLESLLVKLSGRGADLPYPLFRFITEVMATANVDLLVREPGKGLLLSWRDDPFGTGWHVPGSIVRHREEVAHRISACAREEFGCEADVDPRAIALIQIFDDRGHSVSLCHRARLRGTPGRRVVGEGEIPAVGDLRWFDAPPAQMYPSHIVYRDLVAALDRGELSQGIPLFTQHVGRRDAAQVSGDGEISSDAKLV